MDLASEDQICVGEDCGNREKSQLLAGKRQNKAQTRKKVVLFIKMKIIQAASSISSSPSSGNVV